MKKSQKTKVGILEAAKALFWTKGYSNVNLREIAKQAGVDVALIPRYFGNKEGLFNATLDYAFEWNKWDSIPAEDLIEFLVDVVTLGLAIFVGSVAFDWWRKNRG